MKRDLWEKPLSEWTDTDLIDTLAERYKPSEPPPCRVCGGRLSVQRIGGGPTVWACSGMKPDEDRKEGESMYLQDRPADDHYAQSRWEDFRAGGDSLVMTLIERYRALGVAVLGEPSEDQVTAALRAGHFMDTPLARKDIRNALRAAAGVMVDAAPCAGTVAGCAPECGLHNRCDPPGVTTVPVNRPATLEEAQHAAQIGACLPNGVMFDYVGNPRKRYTRVSLDGSHLILDDAQLAEHKANATDPDEYTYSDVYLSEEEADALPEFDGF